jgi:hypothetical protein
MTFRPAYEGTGSPGRSQGGFAKVCSGPPSCESRMGSAWFLPRELHELLPALVIVCCWFVAFVCEILKSSTDDDDRRRSNMEKMEFLIDSV